MAALAAILFAGILTLWIPFRWALSAFEVALFALAAARILPRLSARRSIHLHPVGCLLAGAGAWGLLQIALNRSIDVLKTQEAVLDWSVNLVAFSIALDVNRDDKTRERYLHAIVIFAVILAVVSLFTGLTSPPGVIFWKFEIPSNMATLGPFASRNQYASFVMAVLPLVLVRVFRDPSRRLLYVLFGAVLFGSVAAGGSRAGTALCLAEILIVPAIIYLRGLVSRGTAIRVFLNSLVAVTLLTALVGGEAIWNRFHEPNAYVMRQRLVESSIAMVRDRPWFGFGLGTWSTAYPGYALFDDGNFVNQAHNDWVQWAAEGGIPFLFIMLAIAIWTVRPAVRSVWGVGLLAVFLHGLVDYPMQQRPALAAFFFSLLGCLPQEFDPSLSGLLSQIVLRLRSALNARPNGLAGLRSGRGPGSQLATKQRKGTLLMKAIGGHF